MRGRLLTEQCDDELAGGRCHHRTWDANTIIGINWSCRDWQTQAESNILQDVWFLEAFQQAVMKKFD